MSTIDLKLKSYDELIFEITTLNTNNYLLQQKVEQLEKENKELNRMCELYSQSLYNADLTKAESEIERLNNTLKDIKEYFNKRKEEYSNCKSKNNINYIHYGQLLCDLQRIIDKN